MQVKQKIYTPLKMVKGVLNAKQKDGNYFYAKNIRFNTHLEDANGGFVFEKGNDVSFVIPIVTVDYATTSFTYVSQGIQKKLSYSASGIVYPRNEIEADFEDKRISNEIAQQIIIGYSITRDGLLLFTTDDNGFDCIWYIEDSETEKILELKYCRNLGFSKFFPIEALSNYENENIDKTYWIDGKNQQRSLNIKNPDLANVSVNSLEMVGDFILSQINVINTFPGGTHTSGMIQYAYNLYRLNGSQTKLSPISELVALDKDVFGGGELNETVSKTVSIEIKDLDKSYTNIKIYAVKYTSFNQAPSVSVILDQSIPESGIVSHYDDGNVLFAISSETFLFLGGEILIPNSMNVKNNRMFLSNYVEKSYDLPEINFGCRAFSYDSTGSCIIANGMVKNSSGILVPVEPISFTSLAPIRPNDIYSCINVNYDKYKYNKNLALGGSGEFLQYTLTRSQVSGIDFTEQDAKGRFFKDGELYRISIQFYSKYGEVTTPKWIADFMTSQTSQGNLSGHYATLEVKLLPAFYTYIQSLEESERPIGYKILRAERNIRDRTILAQGIINGTIAIRAAVSSEEYADYSAEAKAFCHEENTVKIPSMIRGFDESLCPMWGNRTYFSVNKRPTYHPKGTPMFRDGFYLGNVNEIFQAGDSDDKRKQSYQFNKLMQFHCPEIEFELLSSLSSDRITVIGSMGNTANNWWGKEIHVTSKNTLIETKVTGGISPHANNLPAGSIEAIIGGGKKMQDYGIVGPTGTEDGYDNNHFYREFKGDFTYRTKSYDIYGKAEIVERGQTKRKYNRDSTLSYTNSIEPMSSDTAEDKDTIQKPGVDRVNSWVCRSAFFSLGSDGDSTESRPAIEDIFTSMGFQDKKSILICEFKINPDLVYLGGLYGGNSYEEKKRTNYIEIGPYKRYDEDTVFIKNPGDTFVSEYKFERISKTSVESSNCRTSHITEIVSYMTETSIDLKRRSDLSLNEWDSKFMPNYEDYKKYNRVYSQESNLVYRKNLDYNFRKVNAFKTSIVATKEKIPNEPIDSWTDVLVNEQITLDGRFGPITALISFKDEIFAFQERAVARISILPRVQISGNDGIAVQLGTGSLFNEYKYITTKSGSKNKWGIVCSEIGMYYLDLLNKSFCVISGEGLRTISDEEGFHKEFIEMINPSWIELDNPLIKKGVSSGYDHITKDIYLSVFDNGKCTTISYNEDQKGFSSYYDYDAPIYIFNKKEMLTVHPGLSSTIMAHFKGEHNIFNGIRRESVYSVILSPEPMVECLFNNLQYNTIARDESNKEMLKTWETVRLYNEFQDSGTVILKDRENIRKKNRQHNITLPRQANSRNRIRNNWAIIELKALNTQGNSVVMHDMVLSYSPNYTVVL